MAHKIIPKEEINKRFAERGKSYIKSKSDSVGFKEPIEFECLIHNCTWIAQLGSTLYKKCSCPECAKETRVNTNLSRYNLWDIRPDVASLLENPDDAINCSEHCKNKKWFICPFCHNRLFKSVTNVSENGLKCNVCSDGFSYPNKLMYQILKSCNIDFITEFSPDWTRYYRYDFYFEKDEIKYIVEMDGGLGHGKKEFKNLQRKGKSSLEVDLEKDKLALNHNIVLIRINSDISDIDYIKNNIMNSLLSVVLPLNLINWDLCNSNAQKSLLVTICNAYNDFPFLSYKELRKQFNICEDVIRKYIRIGNKIGLCPKYKQPGKKLILCTDSNILFRGCKEAGLYYDIDDHLIWLCCNQKRNHTYGLHFVYWNDYDGLIEDLIPDYSIKPQKINTKKAINMYDKEFNYIRTFDSIDAAASDLNLNHRRILRTCKSVHKYNYGMTFYFASDPNQPDKSKIINPE